MGKSTLAVALARRLKGFPLIDKDDSKDVLSSLEGRVPPSELNALSYDIMFKTAATQLKAGMSVIVVCPLAHRHLYEKAVALVEEFRSGPVRSGVAVVECTAVQDCWEERLQVRDCNEASSPQSHKPQSWKEVQTLLDRCISLRHNILLLQASTE